jgi:predicted esterase
MHLIRKTYFGALLFIVASHVACGPRHGPDAGADTIDNNRNADTIDNNSPREPERAGAQTPTDAKGPHASEGVASGDAAPPATSNRAPARTETRELAVPGFGTALVVLPAGNEPRPLLLAAHGAGDSPRWQCRHWDAAVRGRFVILCPRGVALSSGDDPGYFYRNHIELEREVTAALAALKQELGARLSPADGVYSGYSQGATMGALMVIAHGADFPHLVLVEGGSGDWTAGRAKKFRETGGKSVAIVCGTPNCAKRGERSVAILEKAGLRARVEHVEHGGHVYDGRVGERATELLDGWVFGG